MLVMEGTSKRVLPNNIFFAWVEEELAAGRSVRFVVNGFSMMPLLRNGRDEVLLEPCDPQSIAKGNILLFRYKGAHILHRVTGMERQSGKILFRGDNVFGRREECLPSDVVGRVSEIYRCNCGKTVKRAPESAVYSIILLFWRILRMGMIAAGKVKRLF